MGRGSRALAASLALLSGCASPTAASARIGRTAAQQRFQALYPQVRVARGCTQEDAPAVEITFFSNESGAGEPLAPYVRVEISSRARESIAPATFRLLPLRRSPGERRRIVRAELVEKPGSSVWLAGTVAITLDDPRTGITGRVNLISPNREAWSRTFSARYVSRRALCG